PASPRPPTSTTGWPPHRRSRPSPTAATARGSPVAAGPIPRFACGLRRVDSPFGGRSRSMIRWFSLAAALLLGGCSSSTQTPDGGADMSVWTGYDPLAVTAAGKLAAPRGFELHRAVVHLHSVYSWDACDQLGFVDDTGAQDYVHGKVNEGC